MKKMQLKPHLTTSEISSKLMTCINTHHRSYWQILLSVSFNPGKKAEEYAKFLGVTMSKVYRIVELYNKQGANFTEKLEWGGRRDETSFLTIEEEVKMMESFRLKALQGEILTAKDVCKEIEKQLNRKVSDDYVWDLFKRHNWKKKAPRPQHPRHNQIAQEEFKKNSPKFWNPIN
jgi:transposase